MINLPDSLVKKINERKDNNSFRSLSDLKEGVDFYSNDYLGFSASKKISQGADALVHSEKYVNGSTGSRLISGTHKLHTLAEKNLATFHQSEEALLYNSGYDANLGLFSSILQKGDVVLYDDLIHASIRDGIRLGLAKSFKFKHNSLADLEVKLKRFSDITGQLYIAIESVYSMDGDISPLQEIVSLSQIYNAKLIVDEAHSTGVFGENGNGLICELNLQNKIFARVHTFGKAIGAHGAVVLGSKELKDYLINYSRSFIYTTGLPAYSVATIISAFNELQEKKYSSLLKSKILFFKESLKNNKLDKLFIESNSTIQCCLISGNTKVKIVEEKLRQKNFQVKAVLSPTVPQGKERIRICLHLFNTESEIISLLTELSNAIIE